MRIRNRKVPFPLSSLSPVPLSDPPFSAVLQLHSDQPNHPVGDHRQNYSSGYTSNQHEEDKFLCKEGRAGDDDDDDQNGGEEGEKISNDSRKESISGAKTPDGKKRIKGSLKSNGEQITMSMMNLEKDKKIVKTKRGRGGTLMEGSRCSRVNGRGWRCCQPTLVGYSLCEHHLGKGRLRSMTSVRNRSAPNKVIQTNEKVVDVHVCGDDGEEKVQQPLLMAKRKHKLGMVKARSISSLLGQANNAAAINNIAEAAEE